MCGSASELLSHGGISTISVVRTVESVIFETEKKLYFWTFRNNSRHNHNERMNWWMNKCVNSCSVKPFLFLLELCNILTRVHVVSCLACFDTQWITSNESYRHNPGLRKIATYTRQRNTTQRCLNGARAYWTFDHAALLNLMSANKRRLKDVTFSLYISPLAL